MQNAHIQTADANLVETTIANDVDHSFGADLSSAAAHLIAVQRSTRDIVAPSHDDTFFMTDDADIQAGLYGRFTPTDWAHQQLANRTAIGKRYYDVMRDKAPTLLAENVNHWWNNDPEDLRVRVMDDKARAFVSTSYRAMDNYQLAERVLPVMYDFKMKFTNLVTTDRRLYVKAVFPRLQGEVRVGDVVQYGVVISNSEVGAGSLKVEFYLFRLRCLNGMVSGERGAGIKAVHRGARQRANSFIDDNSVIGELYSDDTMTKMNEATFAQMVDAIRGASEPRKFERICERLRETTGHRITGDVQAVVEATRKQLMLTDGESNGVLQHLAEGGDLTQWGLINAVTRTAQDATRYERRIQLERAGTKLLHASPRSLKSILEASND